jgi:hypothetical protein
MEMEKAAGRGARTKRPITEIAEFQKYLRRKDITFAEFERRRLDATSAALELIWRRLQLARW